MASNYTRPKGLRPDTPALEGSDAEPAVVAPWLRLLPPPIHLRE